MRRTQRVARVLLPRVVPDAHFDSRAAALEEVMRRRTDAKTVGAVTRIERSPYEGYVVTTIPVKAVARALRITRGRIPSQCLHRPEPEEVYAGE